MNVIKLVIITLFALLAGCSPKTEPTLKLITNTWIGYTPLYYAKEQGWLEANHIELATVVSLGESTHVYDSVGLDGFTGTQYEYHKLAKRDPSLIPIMMFDRSHGADVVMSNRSISELKSSEQTLDVYLEISSVNYPLFQDFVKLHHLSGKSFNYINGDQLKTLDRIKKLESSEPSIVISYDPYKHHLEKLGFKTVASTGNNLDLIVVDALYAPKATFQQHQKQFQTLKTLVSQALDRLNEDPVHYYETVKPYLENTSYEEFQASLAEIVWLHDRLPDSLVDRLNRSGFPTGDLL